MSIERNYYVIAGYDLTDFKTDDYHDWKWTDQGEKYICYQRKGEIQLFDDPMNGSYLYFGYVFASGDEYDFETTYFSMSDIEKCRKEIDTELAKLVEFGIVSKKALQNAPFKLIAFEESS